MITNLLYTSPHTIIEDNTIDVVYTNTLNQDINRRYAMLRSDIVLLTESNKDLEQECKWLKIPCVNLQNVSKLLEESTTITRFYIDVTDNREILNKLYTLLSPLAKERNICILSESIDSASIKLGKAIKERL